MKYTFNLILRDYQVSVFLFLPVVVYLNRSPFKIEKIETSQFKTVQYIHFHAQWSTLKLMISMNFHPSLLFSHFCSFHFSQIYFSLSSITKLLEFGVYQTFDVSLY